MLCPECGTHNVEPTAACMGCGRPFRADHAEERAPRTAKSRRKGLDAAARLLPGGSGGDRMARLVREAARGHLPPAETRLAGRQQEEDEILRAFLSRVFEINRKIAQESRRVDKDALTSLYTARSFSSPEAMGRATRAVRELFQVNQHIAAHLQVAFDHARDHVEAARWARREKNLFWREFTEGFAAKFQFRSAVLESQQTWAKATAEAYEFALCHNDELRFEGKTVRASSREIGREFVEKVRHAKHCREEFRAAAARFHQDQAAALVHWA